MIEPIVITKFDFENRLKQEYNKALEDVEKFFVKGQCPDCSKRVKDCKCKYKNLFVTINRNITNKLKKKEVKQ